MGRSGAITGVAILRESHAVLATTQQAIALTWAQRDSNWNYLDRPAPVVLPIVSGIITITGPGLYKIETEGGAGTDDLTGITGGSGREWPVILTLNTAGRVITVKHTPPNFLLLVQIFSE